MQQHQPPGNSRRWRSQRGMQARRPLRDSRKHHLLPPYRGGGPLRCHMQLLQEPTMQPRGPVLRPLPQHSRRVVVKKALLLTQRMGEKA